MIIDTRQIQHAQPHKVNFCLEQATLNPKNHEHPYSFHIFDRQVPCEAVLRRSDQDIWIQAFASVQTTPCCDRCLEDFEQVFPFHKTWLCVPVSQQALQDLSEDFQMQDESVYVFNPPMLNLGEIFREQILLDLPMRFLCYQHCQGLCDGCGANLNLEEHSERCEKASIFQQKVQNM